ncbi:MAG: hypothetical protein VXZ49_00455, partial [Planctomycetota bacterium]|nr:hypothetical protein [Planctomycetota bacterium]
GDDGDDGDDGDGGDDPILPLVKVHKIRYQAVKRGRDLQVKVQIRNEEGIRLDGTQVTINLVGPRGDYGDATTSTNRKGLAKFRLRKARRGTYFTTVLDVVVEGYRFDPDDPKNFYANDF